MQFALLLIVRDYNPTHEPVQHVHEHLDVWRLTLPYVPSLLVPGDLALPSSVVYFYALVVRIYLLDFEILFQLLGVDR